MADRDESEALARFSERYATPTSDVTVRIEEAVIGAAWGANGYTTRSQADALARCLDLGPGRSLLDVGTGRGWPGLYLAQSTGCSVVGTDMPFEALTMAAERARAERLERRFALVAAAGAAQPFRRESFDAVVHTDVLC